MVGLEIDGWDGSVSSDRPNYRATLVVGSGLDGRDLLREGVSSSKAGRQQVKGAAAAAR